MILDDISDNNQPRVKNETAIYRAFLIVLLLVLLVIVARIRYMVNPNSENIEQ
jgi:hypothetical protein